MFNFLRRKTPPITASDILEQLLDAQPRPTHMAPRDSRGIYGLVDHFGDLRYIGSTKAARETFYKRIHHRHRTGSETTSHYFSRMYNTGRMWRLRNDPATKADGDLAKQLRSAFIAEHCRAVWVPLDDTLDIASLEAEVISLAPKDVVAWNRRGMEAYEEPVDLVEAMIEFLGFDAGQRAALDRQKGRFAASFVEGLPAPAAVSSAVTLPAFPEGPFQFVALDVETANHDRSSICQIGVACVRLDNSIDTWVTYIDPQTTKWAFTKLHGISASTVAGAPSFGKVLPVLEAALSGLIVYQHSGFDRSAIRAACDALGRPEPAWNWQNSVTVARTAWPELKGHGGHGLASLKAHLGLTFDHHDAGEDARAAAEVVLYARGCLPARATSAAAEDLDVIEPEVVVTSGVKQGDEMVVAEPDAIVGTSDRTLLGHTVLSQGNLNNYHFYLRPMWSSFPEECIGGSSIASAARQPVTVLYGGEKAVVTDLDGTKKIFRGRGWVKEMFEAYGAQAGDKVVLYAVDRYTYELQIIRDPL